MNIFIVQILFVVINLVIFSHTCDTDFNGKGKDMSIINSLQDKPKNFQFKCLTTGIDCALFSCDVFQNKTQLFKLTGSWYCGNNDLTFKFAVQNGTSKSVNTVDRIKKDTTLYLDGSKLSITVDFSENVTLNWKIEKGNLSDPIRTNLQDMNIICNCENVKLLEKKIQSMQWINNNVHCWGLDLSSTSFLCLVVIEKPYLIHYNFMASVSCPGGLPKYEVFNRIHHNEKNIIKSIDSTFNLSDNESIFTETFTIIGKNIFLNMTIHSTFLNITNDTLIVFSSFDAKLSPSVAQIYTNVTMKFKNPGCNLSSSTSPPPSPTTSPITTTTPNTTTPNTPTTTTTTTLITNTTRPTTNTTRPTTKPTIKPSTSTKKHSAHPTKTVLVVLAILIILSVFLVGLYLKKKRRLSNQPAYYNDIALNDPLQHEIEGEENDDDELPLFS